MWGPAMTKTQEQSGAALLIVLMLVVVLSAMAIAMTATMNRLVQQAGAASSRDNALWALHGAEEAGLYLLSLQAGARKGVDTPDESWLREAVTIPIDGGVVRGRFEDHSACFNVNHLAAGGEGGSGSLVADPNSVRRFSLLVEALGADRRSGEILGNSIADFIDDDDRTEPGGAEDFAYNVGDAPYSTAHTRLVDLSELRAIRNWSAPIYRALSPYLCVRPDNSSFGLINVNTLREADAPVLYAALDGRVTLAELDKVISHIPPGGYEKVSEFTSLPVFSSLDPELTPSEVGRFATHSSYIQFSADAIYGNASFRMTTLILGTAGGQYKVISRRFGEPDL